MAPLARPPALSIVQYYINMQNFSKCAQGNIQQPRIRTLHAYKIPICTNFLSFVDVQCPSKISCDKLPIQQNAQISLEECCIKSCNMLKMSHHILYADIVHFIFIGHYSSLIRDTMESLESFPSGIDFSTKDFFFVSLNKIIIFYTFCFLLLLYGDKRT